jgi:RNA polymerase sigma factor (TIGR02999 family)
VGHFLSIAARAMRQILVDHARRRRAHKRGDGVGVVSLDFEIADRAMAADEVIALDDALDRLSALNPRLRNVVELRFFGGLSEEQIATTLGVTTRTVQRDWAKARAWLYREVYSDQRTAPGDDG